MRLFCNTDAFGSFLQLHLLLLLLLDKTMRVDDYER